MCCYWWTTHWPRILSHHHHHQCGAEALQLLSPAMSFTPAEMVHDREVARRNSVWGVRGTPEHVWYMSACGVCYSDGSDERRTHRDHLLCLFPGRTAADNPIPCGCGSERPGWRTICSLAVRGWSGEIGHSVVDLLLSSSRSTPLPLLPLTLSDPSAAVKTWKRQTPHFRLFFSN